MIGNAIRNIVGKLLIDYGTSIKNGTSNISIEECNNILSSIAHIEMTKPEVCEYLNISRSRFDDLVRAGRFPRGKASKHRNNLIWYKDEIMCAIDDK